MATSRLQFSLLLFFGALLTSTTGSSQGGDGPSTVDSVTPALYGSVINGDEGKYQEDWWTSDGWSGGLEKLSFSDTYEDDVFMSLEGRVIVPDKDYLIKMDVKRPETVFFRVGYSERRKYYDGTGGGFIPFHMHPFELRKDLHLDIGHFYLEAGLDIPDKPSITAAYEHRFKDGDKSSTEWGAVTLNGTTRNIFPSFKSIDEEVDILRIKVDHAIGGIYVIDTLQYERYNADITKFEEERNLDTQSVETIKVNESNDHDAFFNTFYLEKQFNKRFFWSMGYLFTHLDGSSGFHMQTLPFGPDPFDKAWTAQRISVDREAHVINSSIRIGPYANVHFYGGIQAETNETNGDTDAVLTETDFGGTAVSPEAVISTQSKKDGLEETAGIRYTGLVYTTAYVEGKWVQSGTDLSETEVEDGVLGFRRQTDAEVNREQYSFGINTSPFRNSTFSVRYREGRRNNDYNHVADTEPGYSAFITDQTINKDDVSVRWTLRPASMLQWSLSYRFLTVEMETRSDTGASGSILSGAYEANVYSTGFTLTPHSKIYFTGRFSYHDAETTSFQNNIPSVLTFKGDVFEMLLTSGFAVNRHTNLNVEYLFSRSENFENYSSDGLPFGLNNKRNGVLASLSRSIGEKIVIGLRYAYYRYDEENIREVDNYEAHLFGAELEFKF
ncbi:MAG: hypothetical protein JW932_06075 [Deltaproteobacteria bacterium]|nr:hypothetical protein [Deltaproteobacteria bacterium]